MDIIAVQLIRSHLESLVEEMQHNFYRSGYSTIVRESLDYSCAVLDAEGRLVVAPALLLHAPIYAAFARSVLDLYGDNLRDGDVFVANHPYLAGMAHVPDMGILVPVFQGGEVVAFTGCIAHKADVGGTVPGSAYGQATELFQEGLLLPPVRLYGRGTLITDVQRIIQANSRSPDLVWGDLSAQVGVAHTGAGRVRQFFERYGKETVSEAFEGLLDASEREVQAALRNWQAGSIEVEGQLDGDPEGPRPVFRVAIEIADGRLRFDFSRSDDQVQRPVNLRRPLIEACCSYCVMAMIDPSLQYTDGIRRAMEIVLRPGSIALANPPAPVSNYMMACQRLIDIILEGLGQLHPERAIAHSGGSGGSITVSWAGGSASDSRRVQYEIFGSGYGAGPFTDGASGVTVHLSNIQCTPVEIVETEFPVRIERFELVPDSGGAGRRRGGLGFRREYTALEPAQVIRRGDRGTIAAKGLAGGEPGQCAVFTIRPGDPDEVRVPGSATFMLQAGDHFRVETPGGAGYGKPSERDALHVEADVHEGYVTREGAGRDYSRRPST